MRGSLIKDQRVFHEAYLPERFFNRDAELAAVRKALEPMAQRRRTRNLWLHGPPGTGKSSVAKMALNEIEERHGIRTAYVNCWETPTLYSTLDKLVRDFRILGAERLSRLFKLERLEKHLEGRPFILALDEIDKPVAAERDGMIYAFCELPATLVVCICNSRGFFHTMDSRARSRLNPVLIEFPPYTSSQIHTILRLRNEWGLNGAVSDDLLREVAKAAAGDARLAIQNLAQAAHAAEREGYTSIEPRHVDDTFDRAAATKRRYLLEKLGREHQLIDEIIGDGEIAVSDLRKEYLKRSQKAGSRPVARRTFSLYLQRMAELGLVSHRRALGVRGNIRLFRRLSGR